MQKADPSECSPPGDAFFCLHGLIIKLLVGPHHRGHAYQTGTHLDACHCSSDRLLDVFMENKAEECHVVS